MNKHKSKGYQRLVLFDIDQTLIKVLGAELAAYSEAFKKVFGVDTTIDIINYHGKTTLKIVIEVLEKNGLDEKTIKPKLKEYMKAMIESFDKMIDGDEIIVLDGVRELLKELDKQNVLTGLVTGSLEQIANSKLKKAGLEHYFKVGGFGSDDIDRTKLVKLAIRRAEKEFDFKLNDNVFLVGDAPQDIKAGKDAGVKTIGVTTGIYSMDDLLKQGSDYVLTGLADADNILNIIFR